MASRLNACEDCPAPADFIVRDHSRGWGNAHTPARLICRRCLDEHNDREEAAEPDPFFRRSLPIVTILTNERGVA